MQPLPEKLAIAPRGPLSARVRVPGSKSITNRALPIAALARGDSELLGALDSDDTVVMREALRALGCEIDATPEAGHALSSKIDGTSEPGHALSSKIDGTLPIWRVRGCDGRLRHSRQPLWVGNSGTTARFLTAACSLATGPVTIDGNERMRERPIDDLTNALAELGVDVSIRGEHGCPPVWVAGGGLPGGEVTIDASRSSQFVSALLLAGPYAAADLRIRFAGGVLVSRPYVDLTLQVMRAFGAEADWCDGGRGLAVRAGRPYIGRRFHIEPDASAAAYPFCAAAIAGGSVRVEGIPADSLQADFALLGILEKMGCGVRRGDGFAEVTGPKPGSLRGIDIDMNDLPDAVLALAVVALFASGDTHIRNVANLRIKETDRLAALENELRKLGANARADADSLHITPGPPRAAEIQTYDDHRMAMAFALAGLRIGGVVIVDPGCAAKTWPGYFTFLEQLESA